MDQLYRASWISVLGPQSVDVCLQSCMCLPPEFVVRAIRLCVGVRLILGVFFLFFFCSELYVFLHAGMSWPIPHIFSIPATQVTPSVITPPWLMALPPALTPVPIHVPSGS